MAMIECWECGSEVSDTAKSCPSCGAKKKKNELNLSERPLVDKLFFLQTAIILLILIVFIVPTHYSEFYYGERKVGAIELLFGGTKLKVYSEYWFMLFALILSFAFNLKGYIRKTLPSIVPNLFFVLTSVGVLFLELEQLKGISVLIGQTISSWTTFLGSILIVIIHFKKKALIQEST